MFFPDWFYQANARKKLQIFKYGNMICISKWFYDFMLYRKYSLQGTTQSRYLTGGVPPVRFSM